MRADYRLCRRRPGCTAAHLGWVLLAGCAAAPRSSPPDPAASAAVERELSPAEIAERALPSVALIRTARGLGTGFVVRKDGLIATSLHVIAGATEASVLLGDSREFRELTVVAVDELRDLALLRVPAGDLAALSLGDSAATKPGEAVVAIGHPLGLGNTVSNGLVSAVRELGPGLGLIQISAPISIGSSGGPIINSRGHVIAVSTMVFVQGQNLNFGTPINAIRPLLDSDGKTSLRELADELERRRPKRSIPRHDLSTLEGCAAEQQARVRERIAVAIKLGAPLFNQGNTEACYRVYEGAVLELERELPACGAVKEALLNGVRAAEVTEDWSLKAWAVRDAFDGMLELLERSSGGGAEPGGRGRRVPRHSLEILVDCPNEEVERFARKLLEAIDVGAPLFNGGNAEACFRVYEGASLELLRTRNGCAGAARALEEGLGRAAQKDRPEDKAWALRDAFDGLLEVLAQQMRLPAPPH